MTTLQSRIARSEELKKSWPVISHELTEWLKDLATSDQYVAEKSDAEVGQQSRIIADLRRRIESTAAESPAPQKPKIRKLNPLPQPER